MSLYVYIVLETLLQLCNNFQCHTQVDLRYRYKVDSVIYLTSWINIQKIIKSRLKLEIRSVERGICPIAKSKMNEMFL